jgi:hypothetical protein
VRSAASGSSTGIVVVQEGESEELADQSVLDGDVVGASIVATLIGREQIQQTITSEHSIKDKINALIMPYQ